MDEYIKSEKYTAMRIVSREQLTAYGKDLVEHIAGDLKRAMSEKILEKAERSDVIVSLKPMRATEQPSWNQVEYRLNMTVGELVRCKYCKYKLDEKPGMVCCGEILGRWIRDDFFCAAGKRREIDEAD